jgi:hypothetical protein
MKTGVVLIAMVLAGCAEQESVDSSASEPRPASEDSVFDPMVQTLDQARGVEQLSADRKRDLDQQIEASE